jgi:hypothetical protein
MNETQAANVNAFRSALADLLTSPLTRGKFVVVHDQAVKGAFDTFDVALRAALSQFPAGEFIIQQVIEDSAVVNFLRAAV